MPASRSDGSITMRVSSSTVPRSATAASRLRRDAQTRRRDLFKPANQRPERLVLFVLRQPSGCPPASAAWRGGRRGRQIANLVRHGADQHARGRHHRIEARRLRGRADSRRRPTPPPPARARRCAIGRQPHVRQEDLAVPPLPLAFHAGAHVAAGVVAVQQPRRGCGRYGATCCPCRARCRSPAAGRPTRWPAARGPSASSVRIASGLVSIRTRTCCSASSRSLQVRGEQPPALVQLRNEEACHGEAERDHQHPPARARAPNGGGSGHRYVGSQCDSLKDCSGSNASRR